jgi:hypothetical protein
MADIGPGRVLVLEDDPTRLALFRGAHPFATYVETAAECVAQLARQDWDDVCLDHDLGGEMFADPQRENTGSGVVRWIVANRPRIRRVLVHSLNGPAATAMVQMLTKAGYVAEHVPFLWLTAEQRGDALFPPLPQRP